MSLISTHYELSEITFITPQQKIARDIRVSMEELALANNFYHTQEQIDELKHKLGVKK